MKILVIGSCTKSKKFYHKNEPSCIDLINKERKNYYVEKFPHFSCKAEDMYKGNQHLSLVYGVKALRKISKVDYFIISAGYGIINSEEIISAYECSFANLGIEDIKNRAIIDTQYRRVIQSA